MDTGTFINIIALVATLIGTFLGAVAFQYDALKQRESRQHHINRLQKPEFEKAYITLLSRGLDWLANFFGTPLSLKALGVSVGLAFIYGITVFIIAWTMGGPSAIGEQSILSEDALPATRWVIVLITVILGLIIYGIFRNSERIDEWVITQFRFAFHSRLSTLIVKKGIRWGSALVLGFAGWLFANPLVGGALILIVISFSPAAAFAVASAIAIFDGVLYVAGVITGSGVEFLSLAGVVAVSGVIFLSVAAAEAVAVIIAESVVLAVAVYAYFTVGTEKFFSNSEIYLFLIVLPLLNGTLDWLSWAISRSLGSMLCMPGGLRVWHVVWHWAADAVAAVVLLVALVVVLVLTIEGLNQWAIASDQPSPLMFDDMITKVWHHPFEPDGLWITFILLSTLFPTALHLTVATVAAINWVTPRSLRGFVIEHLADNPPYTKLIGPAMYLVSRWFTAVIVVIALFTLVVLVIKAFGGHVAEWLYDLAWFLVQWMRVG